MSRAPLDPDEMPLWFWLAIIGLVLGLTAAVAWSGVAR